MEDGIYHPGAVKSMVNDVRYQLQAFADNELENHQIVMGGTFIAMTRNSTMRKPDETALLHNYIHRNDVDQENSFVLGDGDNDLQLAAKLGLRYVDIQDFLPNEASDNPE